MTATLPKLNVVDGGNRHGPPTLFVHGFLSSNLQWSPNLDRLRPVLRTVLVEQPGHGASPDPTGDEAAPERVVAAIDAIRDELGIDRWWLVGHSIGGAVCVRYALAHPQRVRGLVFTNSRAVFGVEDEATDESTGRLAAVLTERGLRALPYHPVHAKRIPADLRESMVATADAMSVTAVVATAARAAAWRSRDDLHRLAVPVLLVNGRWEKRFQPWLEVAESEIRDLRIVHLEGGHSINIEQADAFSDAVLDFIREGDAG